uniref:type I secretion C-terminal target domain-containing protein n=1 Tax=Shewanella atlantica TaxID=271099 RepID=UPI00260CC689
AQVAFTYTATDGTESLTETLTITITGTNDLPVIDATTPINVSEEGLLYGLIDALPVPDDTTDLVTANGTISFTDIDSDTFTITLSGASGLTSGGADVNVWEWDGTTLTGKTGAGTVVMTVSLGAISSDGNNEYSVIYTMLLLAPLDHLYGDNTELSMPIEFGVNISDEVNNSVDTTFIVNVEDDSPVDQLEPLAEPEMFNAIGQYITGNLFAPGADGLGNIVFDVTDSVKDNLLHEGSKLSYVMEDDVTLVARSLADNSIVFTLTAVPDGNGNYDYKLVMFEEIQLKVTVDYDLSTAPAGNNDAYFVDATGEIFSKGDDAANLIATMTGSDEGAAESINSNNHGIGVGDKTSIDDGESIKFDYTTPESGGTNVAIIELGANNNGNHTGVGVISNFYYIVTYASGDVSDPILGQLDGVNGDGTFEISVVAPNGDLIESIEIFHASDGSNDFQVIGVSSTGTITESAIDIDFTYTATDADGDNVFGVDEFGNFSVTLNPAPDVEDYNAIVGNDDPNVLPGTADADYIFGGLGGDTITGGLGGDLLIGGEGSDAIDVGIDADRDIVVWEVGSADGSTDTITNFDINNDALDLSDILVDEEFGVLDEYFIFNFAGGNTEITLDTNGSLDGGETVTIILTGVDLFTEYGVTIDGSYDNADYAVIINGLLDDDALIVDVP